MAILRTDACRAGIYAIACVFVVMAVAGCSHSHRLGSRRDRAEGRGLADGQTAEIQVALGRSLEADGDYEKAMSAYREAARTAPRRHEPQLRMAILLDRLGRFAEATPYYEAALKAKPGAAEIYADRGYSLCLQGRETEGERALRQAITIEPGLARAHNNLGALLARNGRSDEAIAEFRKAGCPESDVQLNMAFALGQGRRWNEAKKHLEVAKRIDPSAKGIGDDVAHLEALIARAEITKPAPSDAGVDSLRDPAVMTVGGESLRLKDNPPAKPRGIFGRRKARKREMSLSSGGSSSAD